MQRTQIEQQGGFSLLAVLIGLVGLAAVATVGVIASDTDNKMSRNEHAYQSAFYAADAAMTDFLVENDTAVSASGSYSYSYGSANVTAASLVDVSDLATLYRVTSVGTYTAPDGSTSTRSLSRIVMFHAGGNNLVSAPGAITSLAGLETTGNSAVITGFNQADSATCSTHGVDMAGTTTPDSMYESKTGDSVVVGNPPIDWTYPTGAELGASLNLPWADVIAEVTVPFDYNITDVKDWPDMSGLGPTDWPVTYFDPSNPNKNTLNAGESGQGLLIIPADAKLSGSFTWDGIIMAGGSLEISGSPTVNGAVMTGLNVITGGTPPVNDLGNGSINLNFNSCFVTDAFANLGQYPPSVGDIPKTWQEAM